MTQHMKNTEIVKTFLDGFNYPSKIQASFDLLADDYHFTNPMMETHSKAEFIPLAMKIGEVIKAVHLIAGAESDDWVATFYEFQTDLPGVEKNDASEWFKVVDGRIKESCLVYDASEWRKIYAQMSQASGGWSAEA